MYFDIKKKNNSGVNNFENNIKFAIIMATYYRKNNKTKQYLYRSIESILKQTFANWDLIIIGDKYEIEDELLTIINEFRMKTKNNIIYINNKNVERDNVKDRRRLWNCAGANSMNIGLNYARHNGYKYYAHIDDDDWWENNHLDILSKAYLNYPHCVFANTQSTYGETKLLPELKIKICPNNLLPSPCGLTHSSFSFRIDIINFNYMTDINNGINNATDALMLQNVRNFISENKNYCSIYMPFLTCNHVEEYVAINVKTIGFIILRHVNSKITDNYWKLSYECIRKYYPENNIIIIDDSSDYNVIDLEFQKNLYKTTVIRSEYHCGELLPYYYYLSNKLFDVAVIIHDSVFINKKIEFDCDECKLLWDFDHDWDDTEKEVKILTNLDNSDELLDFYSKKHLWKGCYGGMSVISYEFLKKLDDKYNISKLLQYIKTRSDRMCFERVIACMMQKNGNKECLFGNIHTYCPCGISFFDAINFTHLPIIKVWTGI